MVELIRVDDRLVHGQVTTTWVPYIKAERLLVASDEVAADRMRTDAIECCAYSGLAIEIKSVQGALESSKSGEFAGSRTILLVSGLSEARRLYDGGMEFKSLNVGNIHHGTGECREITPSVCIDTADEEILERFVDLGVEIDLRDVPRSKPGVFKRRGE
jgi:mannose/fructose/N-acetylgalactosamine-specific phosphotransferase system component IIB